jgi:thioredoxin-like negative regulator of GroEL
MWVRPITPPFPIEITSSNVDAVTAQGQLPTLLDFWAPWCVPCMLMKGTIEKSAAALEGLAVVGLVNVDQCPDLVERFGIRGTPTLILLRDGDEISRWSGMSTASHIKRQVLGALDFGSGPVPVREPKLL